MRQPVGSVRRVTEADARRLLGLEDDATADDVRAARRRLAKAIHPDVAGGDTDAMQRLNEAAATVLAALMSAPAGPASPGTADRSSIRRDWRAPAAGGFRRHAAEHRERHMTGRTVSDVASFVVEALPVEAFDALLVVTSWHGEVVSDDPPYQLDVVLVDPLRCWCRLDIVPDAGASTVSLTIARLADEPLPDIDDVRDLWVAALNELGRHDN